MCNDKSRPLPAMGSKNSTNISDHEQHIYKTAQRILCESFCMKYNQHAQHTNACGSGAYLPENRCSEIEFIDFIVLASYAVNLHQPVLKFQKSVSNLFGFMKHFMNIQHCFNTGTTFTILTENLSDNEKQSKHSYLDY